MDRIYRTVNIKDQETQHYYSHLIQHDARQRCPALIVLKEEHNNNNSPAIRVRMMAPRVANMLSTPAISRDLTISQKSNRKIKTVQN